MIPFRVKKLTPTAKLPERNADGDLWDLFADDFCQMNLKDIESGEAKVDKNGVEIDIFSSWAKERKIWIRNDYDKEFTIDFENAEYDEYEKCILHPNGRILVKTGIAIELPKQYDFSARNGQTYWDFMNFPNGLVSAYAVADIRPRSGLALKHGITVLNTPGTIDNSYRKEIGVILYNAGHEPYTIRKGDKIAQMLIRPLYPSSFEVVEEFKDNGRGGFGSTGR